MIAHLIHLAVVSVFAAINIIAATSIYRDLTRPLCRDQDWWVSSLVEPVAA